MSMLENVIGDAPAWTPLRTRDLEPPAAGVFRPEAFFLGRSEGDGVLRDWLGRVASRVRVTTAGAFRHDRPDLEIRATFTYENGREDPWRWVMRGSAGGDYLVSEARAGAGIVGERRGSDYVICFRREIGIARGWAAPKFVSCLRLIGPATALKIARISYLGVPIASLVAVLKQVGSA